MAKKRPAQINPDTLVALMSATDAEKAALQELLGRNFAEKLAKMPTGDRNKVLSGVRAHVQGAADLAESEALVSGFRSARSELDAREVRDAQESFRYGRRQVERQERAAAGVERRTARPGRTAEQRREAFAKVRAAAKSAGKKGVGLAGVAKAGGVLATAGRALPYVGAALGAIEAVDTIAEIGVRQPRRRRLDDVRSTLGAADDLEESMALAGEEALARELTRQEVAKQRLEEALETLGAQRGGELSLSLLEAEQALANASVAAAQPSFNEQLLRSQMLGVVPR